MRKIGARSVIGMMRYPLTSLVELPQKRKPIPHTNKWKSDFRKIGREFLPGDVVAQIIRITEANSDPEVPNEIMYERAHRKMMSLI